MPGPGDWDPGIKSDQAAEARPGAEPVLERSQVPA
jgi:hypothetical protein